MPRDRADGARRGLSDLQREKGRTMKVTLESTRKIVKLETPMGTVPARIWEGHTESGIPVHAYITRLGAPAGADHTEFLRELEEHSAPTPAVDEIPLRLIL